MDPISINVNVTLSLNSVLEELVSRFVAVPVKNVITAPTAEPATPAPTEQIAESKPEPVYDAVYMRDVMDGVFARFEQGDDLLKAQFHEPLKKKFKDVAAQVSGGRTAKPTQLEPDEMREFVQIVGRLEADSTGNVIEKAPY